MKLSTVLRRMRKNKMFMIGFCLLLIMILLCATSPLWIKWDPEVGSLLSRNAKPDGFKNGLSGHPFGADSLGRDLLSRLFVGGWVSLKIAFIVTLISMFLGALVGLVTGYFGGIVDQVLMRICDVLAAIPQLLMAICIVAVLGNSMGILIFTLTVTGWINTARLVRSAVLGMKNTEFIYASRVLGAKTNRILWKELFPNTVTQLMIAASGHFGGTILVETSLSYLGMGVAPPHSLLGQHDSRRPRVPGQRALDSHLPRHSPGPHGAGIQLPGRRHPRRLRPEERGLTTFAGK